MLQIKKIDESKIVIAKNDTLLEILYNYFMDKIQKLFSDIERLKKHERAATGVYDGEKICSKIKDLFVSSNNSSSLAQSFADYWFSTYVQNASDFDKMPDDKALDVLGAIQAVLDNDDSGTSSLAAEDWKELCTLTNLEAEDLDLDFLNDLMMMFVAHQAV